ncbi:tRNA ligase 1-like [Malania oleifera]|uniref:tRNA ligase 1-like n=1 Tax=Malania oleifera TaxID=397392 RepID=UPI0025AEB274|nr:tRNA ligase 1-like [Malania oleifera]
MPYNQRRGGYREQRWEKKPTFDYPYSASFRQEAAAATEDLTNRVGTSTIGENSSQGHARALRTQFGSVASQNKVAMQGYESTWKSQSYRTAIGVKVVEIENAAMDQADIQGNTAGTAALEKNTCGLNKLLNGSLLKDPTMECCTYSHAQIKSIFYPKFVNEKSEKEIRMRMIEMVSKGMAALEVSLKHSGSLFMYAGHKGGAYSKNSYGNIYTAIGVFVLGRTFCEAWGTEAGKKQTEFNDFLERNHMCISMELVTAVLRDSGQRPQEDYVVVTAVTELDNGEPKFYSTPDIIAFCQQWRLPANHVWWFSTRKSAIIFFSAYDALREEGTATPVCKALDEVADLSVPGSQDYIKVQGEILEGLVARIVSHENLASMKKVLRDFYPPSLEGVGLDLGPSLREICAANRSDERQQIKALLHSVGTSFCPDYLDWLGDENSDVYSREVDQSALSKFLHAHPDNFCTEKLQEMICLMKERHYPVTFKCYQDFHKTSSLSSDNLYFKMVVNAYSDSAFQIYQKEMRCNPGLWPLYRGFFVDINLFEENGGRAVEIAKSSNNLLQNVVDGGSKSGNDVLANEDANLMIKLKFLTYKLRTLLIRDGLPIIFKEGRAAYKAYYLGQMKSWGTSSGKQWALSKMLNEWAAYILRKYVHRQLSSSVYLSEAEPFLEKYAKRSAENKILIGAAGNIVRAEDFLAIVDDGMDEDCNLEKEKQLAPLTLSSSVKETIPKDEGLIVFFPGIPGSTKSGLCREILNAPGGLGDDRPIDCVMGDNVKERYWQKFADECRRKPYAIMLADKNAPNAEAWRQIEDICRKTGASAVPVVPDSEGTDSKPFCLDALAVFMSRVLQRDYHPGNLDKASPNAGYVLLMFYHIHDGKSRKEFEGELVERFGSLVKIPILRSNRSPMPESIRSTLEEGINLYKLHNERHGRLESLNGSYRKCWAKWERKLQDIILGNSEYLNSIQVPFESAVEQVLEQLRTIAKGKFTTNIEKKKFGNVVFAAINLPIIDIQSLLNNLAEKNPSVEAFLRDKHMKNDIMKAYVTLAHRRRHGVTAVARYGPVLHQNVPVDLIALLFSGKMAVLEVELGSVDGEKITSKDQWPHVTIWTASDAAAAKEANTLSQLFSEGNATRININPPITILGTLEFH